MATTPTDPDRDNGKPKCGGNRRGEGAGQTCTRPAGWGTNHVGQGRCKLHGGASPTHVVSGQRALAEQAMRTYGIRRVGVPPALALLEEFEWSLGHVTWLRDIVAGLEPEALVWGKSEETEKLAGEFPGVDTKYLAAPSVWLKLYHDERRMLLDLVKTIETLKLEHRWQEIETRKGALMGDVLVGALDDAGVSGELRARVEAALVSRLRVLAGPVAIEGSVAA